jgi:PII-like signaling protein
MIVIVDAAEAVERFVESVLPLVEGGLVTVEDVDVRHYSQHRVEQDRPEPGAQT